MHLTLGEESAQMSEEATSLLRQAEQAPFATNEIRLQGGDCQNKTSRHSEHPWQTPLTTLMATIGDIALVGDDGIEPPTPSV